MGAFKSYFRPNAGPKATGSKSVENGKVPSRDALLVETTMLQDMNISTASRGPSTPHHPGSRPVSVHPDGDFRNNTPENIDELKNAMAINWVHHVQMENRWNGNGVTEGVVLRKAPRQFIACPDELRFARESLFDAATELNAKVS